jgi:serine/threonine protein kinase
MTEPDVLEPTCCRLAHQGRAHLVDNLSQDGMGVVYRARHVLLRRPTAIKLMATTSSDGVRVQRFEREVQLTSRLTHPNTVAIYDYGHTNDGVFYYAMELLEGAAFRLCIGETPIAQVTLGGLSPFVAWGRFRTAAIGAKSSHSAGDWTAAGRSLGSSVF